MAEAATRLFEEAGYVATTVEVIALAAGVSGKTVYDAFTTKAGLLRAAWDLALKGDADAAPVAVRPWYVAVLEEPDARKAIEMVAQNSVMVKQRIGPLLRVIRDASAVDDDGAALWSLINTDFYDNQRVIVSALTKRKGLRPGLTVTKATDVLWTLNHPDVWLLLHHNRGWSPKEFERWLAEALVAALL
ncbi:MAG TPA: helix-turn-helix domain-containing protein [Acidimicrobiales bacterium]|nr:helix-turn-helix domain-containing protein [Acidimicrobiales bacterium]